MSSHDNGEAPPCIPARLWMIAAVTGAAAFIALLDSTVANLALVAIRNDFDRPFAAVHWVATGYLIALAISLPCAAWLGQRVGHGRTWAVSLAAFTLASAGCALAPGLDWLVVARILQGLAAGLMIPAGQAIVGRVAEPAQLGRLFGVIGLVVSLGPALGPAVGGALIEQFSWRWVFWLNLPVGVLALVAARGLVPAGRHHDDRQFRPFEFIYFSGGMALLLYGVIELGIARAGTLAMAALVAGLGLLAAFVARTRRATQPLIELRMLKSRYFVAAVATAGLAGADAYGGLLLIPIYLQLAGGHGAGQAGLFLLVMGLGAALAMPMAGLLADRFGGGRVAFIGGLLLVATTVSFQMPSLSSQVLVLILALRGAAIAWLQIPSMTSAYEFSSNRDMGDAAALVNIAQRIGGAIGAAILAIAVARFGDGPDAASEAFGMAFMLLAGISMAALLAATALAKHERLSALRQVPEPSARLEAGAARPDPRARSRP